MKEKAIILLAVEIVILVILKTYKCFGVVLLFICLSSFLKKIEGIYQMRKYYLPDAGPRKLHFCIL